MRCRTLLIQICDAEHVSILKGVVSKEHVHMHIEYCPSQCVSGLVKKRKGCSSRKLQQEFPELKKRYWGRHFWAIGFGCWSIGSITDEMVNAYLEHLRKPEMAQTRTLSLKKNTGATLSREPETMDFQSIVVHFFKPNFSSNSSLN